MRFKSSENKLRLMVSNMHLHSFNCSFCVIIIGLVLLINALTLYLSSGRLLAIVESFHHASSRIWTCLWKQKVILNSSIWLFSIWNFWSVVRYILHKTSVSFIHMTWRTYLFIWVIESRSSSVWPIASKIHGVIQLLSLV